MKKYKFRNRLLLTNTLLIGGVITTFCIFFLFYFIGIQSNKSRAEQHSDNVTVSENVKNSIDLLDSISLQLSANNYIIDAFYALANDDTENYFENEVIEKNNIHRIMWSYILKADMASRVCIYNKEGDFVHTGDGIDNELLIDYLSKDRLSEMEDMFENSSDNFIVLLYPKDMLTSGDLGYISVIREIKNYPLLSREVLGYVEVQVSLEVLDRKFFSQDKNKKYYIGKIESEEIVFSSDQGERQIPEGAYYSLSRVPIEKYSLMIYQVQDNRSQMIFLRNMVLGIFGLFLMLMIGVYLMQKYLVMRMTRPLIELCDSINEIEVEKQVEQLQLKEDIDEFGQLNLAFNQMLENLRRSMNDVVLARTSEINAQLMALQAQMNPHFIHNTITIIGALADDGENAQAVEMCEKLSQMIRYNTEFSDRMVILADEIEHTKNYLEMMKIRYEDSFHYQMLIQSSTSIRVPKFVLQPLVENCFMHGFKKKEFPWNIRVRCREDDEKWYLEVEDNGTGISIDRIKEVEQHIEQMKSNKEYEFLNDLKIGGLSLTNIVVRLWMNYGEDMYFHISNSSLSDRGMKICIGGIKDD
ncbi:MAG: sensor histidine kinase [Lachnospiraceae bacterium]